MFVLLAVTTLAYLPGLSGPFIFDDTIHITQNSQVQIPALSWAYIKQAWQSSLAGFPSDRPLAQLSFGLNHALGGLDSFHFKLVNLCLHLITGLVLFATLRQILTVVARDTPNLAMRIDIIALAVTALWLLHPLNVSTVLYTVQRMTQISTLALFGGVGLYVSGRLRLAQGDTGATRMLAAYLLAALGFFGKENTVLLPGLLLACELTVLHKLPTGPRARIVHIFWLVGIALPVLGGVVYLATHPNMYDYSMRPFTVTERLLTEPRVLWTYLHWIFVPNIADLGFFHDDLTLSRDLLTPLTTVISLLAWGIAIGLALTTRRRYPVFGFGVLFYLAAHALESGLIPLEVVFEHRNYLAMPGPLLLMAYLVLHEAHNWKVERVAPVLGGLLLLSYAAVTYLRASDWGSEAELMFSEAEHHPESPRANFQAAQLLIAAIGRDPTRADQFAPAARDFLHAGLKADPGALNCLFGLLVLDLHLDKTPPPDLIDRLTTQLRSGYIGPTKLAITQFNYLVTWQRSGVSGLTATDMVRIFEAVLANPTSYGKGRAGIETAYRAYLEFVLKDLPGALLHAEQAVRLWPDRADYQMNLARVQAKLGRYLPAHETLQKARKLALGPSQQTALDEMEQQLEGMQAPAATD